MTTKSGYVQLQNCLFKLVKRGLTFLTSERHAPEYPGTTMPALFKRITDFAKAGQRQVTMAAI